MNEEWRPIKLISYRLSYQRFSTRWVFMKLMMVKKGKLTLGNNGAVEPEFRSVQVFGIFRKSIVTRTLDGSAPLKTRVDWPLLWPKMNHLSLRHYIGFKKMNQFFFHSKLYRYFIRYFNYFNSLLGRWEFSTRILKVELIEIINPIDIIISIVKI